jgi:hypothetical protein
LIRLVKQNVKAVEKFFGSGGKMKGRPEKGVNRRQKKEGTRPATTTAGKRRVQGTRSRKERQTTSNEQAATGSMWPTADHGKRTIDY